ncbi:MAG: hypothetical protein ABMA01_12595, partial [Chthoniobacteraceae bacterium]
MFLRIARIIPAVVVLAALPSCAWPWKKEIPRAQPIRFPSADATDTAHPKKPRQVGTILMVNTEGNFVLIDSSGWTAPEPGTALKCFRDGTETGVIAVGSERQGTRMAADVVTGTPRKGDGVF